MTIAPVAAPAPNPLVATTQLLEKLVGYIPMMMKFAPEIALIPGVGPEISTALTVAGSIEPIAVSGLKMLEDIETAGASGSPFAIFAAIEKHAGDMSALAAQIKAQFPALPIPDLSHLPGIPSSPVAPAGPGVTSAEQAANNLEAPTG